MATGDGGRDRQREPAPPAGRGRWAIVLAGGDGTRLRELTRRLAGDDRPKQFCPLLGEEALLGQTRRRVALGLPASRTLFSLTAAHERFYAPMLAGVRPRQLVVQPENRGTAPAILYAALRIAATAPADPVALFPSDHHVSDDARFMAHVEAAFALVEAAPDLVALLGIVPDRPETEYGWIEAGEPATGAPGWPAYRVRRFWEKPALDLARTLLGRGCLWNSFVMVGRVATLLGLVERTLPEHCQAFLPLRDFLGTPVEAAVARTVYERLPPADFSRGVLVPSAARLAVVPVRGLEWSDLGSPDRVRAARGRMAAGQASAPPAALAAAAG